MDLLIKNAAIINAGGRLTADIAVRDGKIEAITKPGTQHNAILGDASSALQRESSFGEVADAAGLLVLPGAIDAHTHFELNSGGVFTSADGFFTGTRAAACGGVTAVIDFVTPGPGGSLPAALEKRRFEAGPEVCIDYGLHMSIVEINERTFQDMETVMNDGISSFKLFTTYAFRLSDDEFIRAFAYCKQLGALAMVHAEAHEELESRRAAFIAQGKTDPWHHYLSRPEEVEAEGIRKVIALAGQAGPALYIVHIACAEGLAAVRKAQLEGCPVMAETCPQYLHFTSDVYKRPDGHIFVCSPPMKGAPSRDALWQGVIDGTISTVATDHCPFTLADKASGKDDFTKIPNGVMGVETLYPYMLSHAACGRIPFERAAELCCAAPAKIFGLDYCKGTIAPGMDADLVIFDPHGSMTVSQAASHSAAGYTIWEGTRLKGCIKRTYSRGRLVHKDGEFTGERGSGRFIKRSVH